MSLQSAHENQNKNNKQNHADRATGIVAPSTTIGPCWNSRQQEKDENNKQNGAHIVNPSDKRRVSCRMESETLSPVTSRCFRTGP